jgi:hypothetical protein
MLVLGRLAARNRACQQDAVREGVVPVLVEMMMDGKLATPGTVCCLFQHWGGLASCTFCSVPPEVQGWSEVGGAFQSQQQPVVFACCVRPGCIRRTHAYLSFDDVSLCHSPSKKNTKIKKLIKINKFINN